MSRYEVVKIATLTGHRDSIYTLEGAGTEKHFFSSGADGLVAKWDLEQPETGELIANVPASVYALHYIAEKNILLVGQNFEGIHAIDVAEKKERKSIKITSAAIFDIKSLTGKIYVAAGDGTVFLLEEKTLKIVDSVKLSDKSARTIAVHPATGNIAVGYSDNYIRIFDGESLNLIKEFSAHNNSVFTLAFTPDGKYLLSGSRDAHLKIWDSANDYALQQSIVAHMFTINHITFSPDQKLFATCSMDKTVKVWDAATFRLLKVIDKARHAGHGTSVNKLYWPSKTSRLVSCSDDRSISVWDMKPASPQPIE